MPTLDKIRDEVKVKPRGMVDKILEGLIVIAFILLLLICFKGTNFDNMPYGDDDLISNCGFGQ